MEKHPIDMTSEELEEAIERAELVMYLAYDYSNTEAERVAIVSKQVVSPTAQGSATPKSRSTSPTVLTKNNNWAGCKWPALFCRNKRAIQTLLQKSMVSAPHWDVDSSDLERRRAGCDRPALLFERPAEAILNSSGDSPGQANLVWASS